MQIQTKDKQSDTNEKRVIKLLRTEKDKCARNFDEQKTTYTYMNYEQI